MAFTAPLFTIVQRNDSKLITITDSTGTGTDGWDGTPAVTDINASTNSLTLDITITTSDGAVTDYDTINLYTEFGPFTTTADLVFELDMSMLLESGIALGTSDDLFPDGLYNIVYTYQKSTNNLHSDYSILIDGTIKADIYEALRTMSTKYECADNHEKDILDIIFTRGYYDGLLATATVGRSNSVITQLRTLEGLVTYGSNYTW